MHRALQDEEGEGVAKALHVMGCVCCDQGDYPAARRHLEQALAIRRRVHGGARAVHSDIADSLQRLGHVFVWEGNFATAKVHLERLGDRIASDEIAAF